MRVGDFELVNDDKLRRVIEGQPNAKGEMSVGLGEAAIEDEPDAVIAQYDRLGGLIRGEEGAKVKTGCFWDFKKNAPISKPKVVYEFRVNGQTVELDEDEEPTLEMKAAKKAAGQKGGKKGIKKTTKKAKVAGTTDEVEETTDLEKEGGDE